jgi:hypothetical protein
MTHILIAHDHDARHTRLVLVLKIQPIRRQRPW